jgi:hypothetical protein
VVFLTITGMRMRERLEKGESMHITWFCLHMGTNALYRGVVVRAFLGNAISLLYDA